MPSATCSRTWSWTSEQRGPQARREEGRGTPRKKAAAARRPRRKSPPRRPPPRSSVARKAPVKKDAEQEVAGRLKERRQDSRTGRAPGHALLTAHKALFGGPCLFRVTKSFSGQPASFFLGRRTAADRAAFGLRGLRLDRGLHAHRGGRSAGRGRSAAATRQRGQALGHHAAQYPDGIGEPVAAPERSFRTSTSSASCWIPATSGRPRNSRSSVGPTSTSIRIFKASSTRSHYEARILPAPAVSCPSLPG
jgi:hypothetical protein